MLLLEKQNRVHLEGDQPLTEEQTKKITDFFSVVVTHYAWKRSHVSSIQSFFNGKISNEWPHKPPFSLWNAYILMEKKEHKQKGKVIIIFQVLWL